MVGLQLRAENPSVLVFPTSVSPSSLFPLFLSPLFSLSGSSNGTYSSLKTPAKSCSNHGFVETWHPVPVHSWLTANERLQQRQRLPLPGAHSSRAVAVPTPKDKSPEKAPSLETGRLKRCPGAFKPRGDRDVGWNHHLHPQELRITFQLLLGWK